MVKNVDVASRRRRPVPTWSYEATVKVVENRVRLDVRPEERMSAVKGSAEVEFLAVQGKPSARGQR